MFAANGEKRTHTQKPSCPSTKAAEKVSLGSRAILELRASFLEQNAALRFTEVGSKVGKGVENDLVAPKA